MKHLRDLISGLCGIETAVPPRSSLPPCRSTRTSERRFTAMLKAGVHRCLHAKCCGRIFDRKRDKHKEIEMKRETERKKYRKK